MKVLLSNGLDLDDKLVFLLYFISTTIDISNAATMKFIKLINTYINITPSPLSLRKQHREGN